MRLTLLAALVVLSGCSGLAADPTTESVTPAPVPVTTPTSPYPPGITADGVVDAAALARAHADALSGRSFTSTRLETRRDANGTFRERHERTIRVGGDDYHYLLQTTAPGATSPNRTVERWGNATHTYRAVTVDGTRSVSLTAGGIPFAENGTSRQGIARLFSLLDTRLAGETVRNGTPGYRLVVGPNATVPPSLANVSLVAFVDRDGVVRAYDLTYLIEHGTDRFHVEVRVRFSAFGSTTVPRPAWVPEAGGDISAGTARRVVG